INIPISSQELSFNFNGNLAALDLKKLNTFLPINQHRKLKSGILMNANYKVNVTKGHSSGQLFVQYKDLYIALTDKKTTSDKGIFNVIISFVANNFKFQTTNINDKKHKFKIGKIKYDKKSEDTFIQVIWFSIRNGIGDVVGF